MAGRRGPPPIVYHFDRGHTMSQQHRQIINRYCVALEHDVGPCLAELLTYLVSYELFNRDDVDFVNSKSTYGDRVHELMKRIVLKSSVAFPLFCHALSVEPVGLKHLAAGLLVEDCSLRGLQSVDFGAEGFSFDEYMRRNFPVAHKIVLRVPGVLGTGDSDSTPISTQSAARLDVTSENAYHTDGCFLSKKKRSASPEYGENPSVSNGANDGAGSCYSAISSSMNSASAVSNFKVLKIDNDNIISQLGHIRNEKAYNTLTTPRGRALIINNVNFVSSCPRSSSDEHSEMLKHLLEQLGYRVQVKRDLTAAGIKSVMAEFAKHPDHASAGSAVVSIMSHGCEDGDGRGVVSGTDDQTLTINQFTELLGARNCKNLAHKPKWFIIQACRGKQHAHVELDAAGDFGDGGVVGKSVGFYAESSRRLQRWLPHNAADFIVSYSTASGYVSVRDFYIPVLCEKVAELAKSTHLADILCEVNGAIRSLRSPHDRIQVPSYENLLDRAFYFFPGHSPRQ